MIRNKKIILFIFIMALNVLLLSSCSMTKNFVFDVKNKIKSLFSDENTTTEFQILSSDYQQPDILKSMVKKDSKNILLIGVDKSSFLTDTLCWVNIDNSDKKISLFMIPRDAYVPYNDTYKNVLRDKKIIDSKGIFKINASSYIGKISNYSSSDFEDGSMSFLHDVLKELLGVSFDDYIKFNFEGFTELVDMVGGVDVTVDTDIRNFTGAMEIPAGQQHLNGRQALFYARTRYLYDENGKSIPTMGDKYRKENQLRMIKEMMNQMITIDFVPKIPELLQTLDKNVSHSISSTDFTSYSVIGLEYAAGSYSVESQVITGESADPLNDKASYVIIK
jgi:LCP family protein required for cell wall assembly